MVVNKHSFACDFHILAGVDLLVQRCYQTGTNLKMFENHGTLQKRTFPSSRIHFDLSKDNHCGFFFSVKCGDIILVRKILCNNSDNILKYA